MGRLFRRGPKAAAGLDKADVAAALNASAPEHGDTLVEVDLGERLVCLQAWNTENRDKWIDNLKHWTTFRRRVLDDAAFSNWSSLAMYKSGMAFAVNPSAPSSS